MKVIESAFMPKCFHANKNIQPRMPANHDFRSAAKERVSFDSSNEKTHGEL
ncbi:hypothetical protein [Methanosarcina siciliae]|uniref:hypothetical protein n=1 Tax=Methanosarcina siciliae TaxID=38027 RepID=UPI0012DFF29B|nr:hypothetical protein [Methanosarcina siciliae]